MLSNPEIINIYRNGPFSEGRNSQERSCWLQFSLPNMEPLKNNLEKSSFYSQFLNLIFEEGKLLLCLNWKGNNSSQINSNVDLFILNCEASCNISFTVSIRYSYIQNLTLRVARGLLVAKGEVNLSLENITISTDRITSGITVDKTCEQNEIGLVKIKNITFSSDSFLQISSPLMQLTSNSIYEISQITFNTQMSIQSTSPYLLMIQPRTCEDSKAITTSLIDIFFH